jgi:hypothetical protein
MGDIVLLQESDEFRIADIHLGHGIGSTIASDINPSNNLEAFCERFKQQTTDVPVSSSDQDSVIIRHQ